MEYIDYQYFINTYKPRVFGDFTSNDYNYYIEKANEIIGLLIDNIAFDFEASETWRQNLVKRATAILTEHWLKQGNDLSLENLAITVGNISSSSGAVQKEYVPHIVLDLLIKAGARRPITSFGFNDEPLGDSETYSAVFKNQIKLADTTLELTSTENEDPYILSKEKTMELISNLDIGIIEFATGEFVNVISLEGSSNKLYESDIIDTQYNELVNQINDKANIVDIYDKDDIDKQQQVQDLNFQVNKRKITVLQKDVSTLKTNDVKQDNSIAINASNITILKDVVNSVNKNYLSSFNETIGSSEYDVIFIPKEIITNEFEFGMEDGYAIRGVDTAETLVSFHAVTLPNTTVTIVWAISTSEEYSVELTSDDDGNIYAERIQIFESGKTYRVALRGEGTVSNGILSIVGNLTSRSFTNASDIYDDHITLPESGINIQLTQIDVNTDNITTNTDNITTNTDNITTNTDNITTNTDNITSLQSGKMNAFEGTNFLNPSYFSQNSETGIISNNFYNSGLETEATHGVDAINEINTKVNNNVYKEIAIVENENVGTTYEFALDTSIYKYIHLITQRSQGGGIYSYAHHFFPVTHYIANDYDLNGYVGGNSTDSSITYWKDLGDGRISVHSGNSGDQIHYIYGVSA